MISTPANEGRTTENREGKVIDPPRVIKVHEFREVPVGEAQELQRRPLRILARGQYQNSKFTCILFQALRETPTQSAGC